MREFDKSQAFCRNLRIPKSGQNDQFWPFWPRRLNLILEVGGPNGDSKRSELRARSAQLGTRSVINRPGERSSSDLANSNVSRIRQGTDTSFLAGYSIRGGYRGGAEPLHYRRVERAHIPPLDQPALCKTKPNLAFCQI